MKLAGDPAAFGLLQHQGAARTVAPLELQSLEHLVERRARARRRPDRRRSCARVPGDSGSWRRIVSASSSSGRNAGRSNSRLTVSSPSRPAPSTIELARRDRHRHAHRCEHQPGERQRQHQRVGHEDPPEQREGRPLPGDVEPAATSSCRACVMPRRRWFERCVRGPEGLRGDVDDADAALTTVGQGDVDVVSGPGAEERFPDG